MNTQINATAKQPRHIDFAVAIFNEMISHNFTLEDENEAIAELINRVIKYRQGAIFGCEVTIKELQHSIQSLCLIQHEHFKANKK